MNKHIAFTVLLRVFISSAVARHWKLQACATTPITITNYGTITETITKTEALLVMEESSTKTASIYAFPEICTDYNKNWAATILASSTDSNYGTISGRGTIAIEEVAPTDIAWAEGSGWAITNFADTPVSTMTQCNMGIDLVDAEPTTSTVTASVPVITTTASSGEIQFLPTLSTEIPDSNGTINTSLETTGHVTSNPIISTSISSSTSVIQTTAITSVNFTATVDIEIISSNIFQPVATSAPPANLGSRTDHPVPRLGIVSQQAPIGTNKFYANFFLGSQTAPTWTHPYSVAWSKGGGPQKSWGMSIMHIDDNQKVFGPNSANSAPGAASFFINPVGIQSLILSEASLGISTTIATDYISAMSVNVNFLPSVGAPPVITFPLVQGMGFVTGKYSGGTPIIQTGVFFRTVTKSLSSPKDGVTKYTILLEDDKTWLLYASSPSNQNIEFTVVNNGLMQATSGFTGNIQIAKSSGPDSEALYDAACGAYAVGATISGSVNGDKGFYSFDFDKNGFTHTTLVMFALPHHIASFALETAALVASAVKLATTTKGDATAVKADSWTLRESLPISMGFAPWSISVGNNTKAFSAATAALINQVAASEVSQDMNAQTNLNSMYYSGKALAKFAGIIYVLNDLLANPSLALAGLANLKTAFALFVSNRQQFPLVYETAWRGVVSSASYTTGDSGADFGNSYYNDHHFHYGYFIYAASIIAHLDPSWLTANSGANKAYINTLVRDTANPSVQDPYFPVSRAFDWYHGHSWAHGLYESYDGKDQESSSEDAMFAYALKMWGLASGNQNLEAQGNIQLAINARAIQSYYLYKDGNTIEPPQFVGNKVAGILFENKIDHATYFGANPEFVQGIHMLPLLPCSGLTRKREFVQQEWGTWFDGGRAEAVQGGWKGVLFANLALWDPVRAWDYFTGVEWNSESLDGGASLTWYLAWASGLGGGK